ncbi:MAG TPA: sialidase family protein, partial [Blastocatellia bacterium]
DWQVSWANFPSIIALPDGTLAAHWLVKNGAGAHTCDVNVARSSDGGKTWSKPIVPHRDNTPTEHGFVSMLPLGGGRAGAVWLDGRKSKPQEGEGSHAGHHGSSASEMTLRYATIDANGRLSEEVELDGRVCDCCQTSAAATSEGAVVVYRDRSGQEVRDISIVRLSKGKWSAPVTLHADGWRIEGCPVNGPSVAADGDRVAVAWFTMIKDTPRVNVAFSSDAGASFARPIQVDEGAPFGHVGVVMLGDGSAVVSWLEKTAKGGEVKARRVRPDGPRAAAITIAPSSAARATGFPRMARNGDEIVLAWTDSAGPARVRTAVMKVAGR